MSMAPVVFGNAQESGNAELAGASPLAMNVVTDGRGAVRRRPCITTWSGFPTTIPLAASVIGMHTFGSTLYYVADGATDFRTIYKVTGGAATRVTDITDNTTYLAGSSRPVFAETAFRLVIAGGEALQDIDSTGASARLGGTPPDCSHVAALANRLFIDDNTSSSTIGRIRYSGLGLIGAESWDALNLAAADARPDDIVALRENANELWAFGETSLQIFEPDAIAVIAPGRTQNIGCSAAHSVVRVDDGFAWLDDQRRFVFSDGRGFEEISGAIAGTLDGTTTVSDCYGYRVNTDQFDLIAWTFPSDGRTFVWQRDGGWSQWSGWTTNYGYTLFGAKSHFYWPSQNLHLVGLSTGQIAQLDTSAYSDLGNTVKCEVRTGFLSRETMARKVCRGLRLLLKRGVGTGQIRVSWRDDGGEFGQPVVRTLGTTGDYNPVVELRGLGAYRQRQWRIEVSDAVEFVLAGAEEEFDVMPS